MVLISGTNCLMTWDLSQLCPQSVVKADISFFFSQDCGLLLCLCFCRMVGGLLTCFGRWLVVCVIWPCIVFNIFPFVSLYSFLCYFRIWFDLSEAAPVKLQFPQSMDWSMTLALHFNVQQLPCLYWWNDLNVSCSPSYAFVLVCLHCSYLMSFSFILLSVFTALRSVFVLVLNSSVSFFCNDWVLLSLICPDLFLCLRLAGWGGHCRTIGSSGSLWPRRPVKPDSASAAQPLLWLWTQSQDGRSWTVT